MRSVLRQQIDEARILDLGPNELLDWIIMPAWIKQYMPLPPEFTMREWTEAAAEIESSCPRIYWGDQSWRTF